MSISLIADLKRPWDEAYETVRRNFRTIELEANRTRAELDAIAETVIVVDTAVPQFDATDGSVFRLAALGNRLMTNPLNAEPGKRITVQHFAAGGANRTLSLATGVGGFRFGSTITGLTATVSGETDYIDAVYNDTDQRWDVVNYVKGYV